METAGHGSPSLSDSSPCGCVKVVLGLGPLMGEAQRHPWQMQSLPAALERQLVGEQGWPLPFPSWDIGPVPPLGLAGLLS